MTISDERFELNMQGLEADGLAGTASELRARDTAQREALARVEAERDAIDQKLLAKTGAHEFLKYGLNNLVKERDTAQAQLAQAVGLLRDLHKSAVDGGKKLAKAQGLAKLFLARVALQERHAQAEQQEGQQTHAQGAQADMELVGYANFDQLDNMLDDRTATIHPKRSGLAGTPVYRARVTGQGAQAWDERAAFEAWTRVHNESLKDDYPDQSEDIKLDMQGGVYCWSNTDCAWKAWKACASLHAHPDLLEPWDVLEALADGYERGYQDGQSNPNGYSDKLAKHRVAAELLAAVRGAEHE